MRLWYAAKIGSKKKSLKLGLRKRARFELGKEGHPRSQEQRDGRREV